MKAAVVRKPGAIAEMVATAAASGQNRPASRGEGFSKVKNLQGLASSLPD
jgi:hypothetical protein